MEEGCVSVVCSEGMTIGDQAAPGDTRYATCMWGLDGGKLLDVVWDFGDEYRVHRQVGTTLV